VLAVVASAMWWKSQQALTIFGEVFGGIFTAIVTATAFGDVALLDRKAVAERALERSWAIILLGFGIDLFAFVGLIGLQAHNVVDTLLASGILLMSATLMFAPVDATISDDAWWWILPSSIVRSISVAWKAPAFSRALIVLALGEVAPYLLLDPLQRLVTVLHLSQPGLWASGLVTALLVPPVQTLATFAYLDAIGYEPKRTCSE
jgi:hypothetical protein